MALSEQLKAIRERFDDAIRSETKRFQSELAQQFDDEVPQQLLLSDWVLVTNWIDPSEPEANWYHKLESPGLSPHASTGLLAQYAGE